MPQRRIRSRLLLLSAVCLLAVTVLAGTARAESFGEVQRFGEGGGKELSEERTRALGVDTTENGVFVLDEYEEPTQKKEPIPECEPEPEPEPGECEVGVGPITRHLRIQKYSPSSKGKYSKAGASVKFTDVSPESFGVEPKVEGIAVDPTHERLYVLTDDARESTDTIDKSEKSSETPAPALLVASTIYAFSTKEVGEELVPWGGKGTSPVFASPTTLQAQSDTPGQALLQPVGITVDPAKGEPIILGHVDLKGEATDSIANSEDHYALQRITATGTLGERYVDTSNYLKSSLESPPNSPIVTGASGSEKVYVAYRGLAEIPYKFTSTEAPHAVGPSLASEEHSIEHGGLGEALGGVGGGLTAAPPEGKAPDGTIFGLTSITNEAEFYSRPGVAERSGENGAEIGWTGGQEAIEPKVTKDFCVIEPDNYELPVAVAAGSGGKLFVLAPEFLLRTAPGEPSEKLEPPFFDGVIEFAPEGTGCPAARIAAGIVAEANGTKLPEGEPIKAGAHVTLSSHVDQADALKVEWEFVNEKTKETIKETVAPNGPQNPQVAHTFEQPGTFAVTETVHTDDLASSTPLVVKRTFTVDATKPVPKAGLPESASVVEGESAVFKAEATGDPTPTVQWEVSTNGGTSWSEDTTDKGSATDTLTVEHTKLSESGNEYRAVFTNEAGKAETEPATLTVSGKAGPPEVTKQPVNDSVTEPASATFTAEASGTPVPTVQWEVSTNGGTTWAVDTTDKGNTTDTLTVEDTNVSESGNEYRAVFKNTAGKETSSAATLTVLPKPVAPEVTEQPQTSVTVTAPASATFTAKASGTPTPTVQWQVSTNKGGTWANDTIDKGNTTDTLTIENTKGSESGNEYRAVFTNSAGKAESHVGTLTVNEAPAVTTEPKSTSVTETETATFTAAASGAPAPSVQWQVSTNKGVSWANDTTDKGATTGTLTIEDATFSENEYEYRAVFTNNVGPAVESSAATLTVTKATLPAITEQPLNDSVQEPATATFTAKASGTPAPTVQWEVSTDGGKAWTDDTADGGNTTDTLTISNTSVSESGYEYRAAFKNVAGEKDSNPVTLTVVAQPPNTGTGTGTTTSSSGGQPGGGVDDNRVVQTPAPVPDANLASTGLTVSSSGAIVLKVTCPSGETTCEGTLTLRTLNAVAAAGKKKSILTLASGTFTVVGGQVKSVTLHLSAAARALLARSHGLLRARATLVAHDPAAATHTTETTVTLRAAKKKHG
jgi:hypothetical protein